ncbi:Fe2+-dicitrate sensor, membrane component [Bernardetia litoralis DSM 6794]|uniref:Fe2+-dicitrate sensor, membrane component n=1 Tax=Bernardetia litoralis (strain ATCC 23117 / DSM 6794 / NBRC 15988 / NCIMB 1366 / Fx l1 / Sio-4) TaxID=880071 RepID=I4APN2_BERLS|nr:FecR family protein [Bernardetia litoralis]AFM05917.1 Fe2+-dicitrate sensor, membrane component [Bernardetia litoralis DSM 6794]
MNNNEIKLTNQQIEYIARYISKEPSELSEIQKIQVEKWRKEIPFFEKEFQNYSKIWKESNHFGQKLGKDYSPNVEKGWQKLSQQIKEYEATKTVEKEWVKPAVIAQKTTKSISISKSIFKEIGKIAAILIVGLGLGWWINSTQNTSDSLANSKQIIVHQHSDTPLILPDGSKIWLNKNATISYNSDFGKFEHFNQKRTLKLNGEAFFDIARDEKHPFMIDVEGKAEVEVLGTSFNINPNNEKVEVTVASGKVNFKNTSSSKKDNQKQNSILLTKGEKGILYDKTKNRPDSLPSLVHFEKNDDVNYLAWLNHRLVFENMQMQEVVSKVENYYNVRLKLENSNLKECRFTGTFDQTPLNDVLETLSFGANLQIKKSDSTTYLLSGSGCR